MRFPEAGEEGAASAAIWKETTPNSGTTSDHDLTIEQENGLLIIRQEEDSCNNNRNSEEPTKLQKILACFDRIRYYPGDLEKTFRSFVQATVEMVEISQDPRFEQFVLQLWWEMNHKIFVYAMATARSKAQKKALRRIYQKSMQQHHHFPPPPSSSSY